MTFEEVPTQIPGYQNVLEPCSEAYPWGLPSLSCPSDSPPATLALSVPGKAKFLALGLCIFCISAFSCLYIWHSPRPLLLPFTHLRKPALTVLPQVHWVKCSVTLTAPVLLQHLLGQSLNAVWLLDSCCLLSRILAPWGQSLLAKGRIMQHDKFPHIYKLSPPSPNAPWEDKYLPWVKGRTQTWNDRHVKPRESSVGVDWGGDKKMVKSSCPGAGSWTGTCELSCWFCHSLLCVTFGKPSYGPQLL